jgi:acyl-CoA synthetase (AMP-forming)/AMP-acid ligase II
MTGVSELTSNRQDISRNPFQADESLPACFERVAERHRLRPALASDVWQASYEELNVTANRLAHALMARSGAPRDRIAILMQHDTPMIAALLAVLKANRIVVALNPTNPAARLRQLMDDAEPAAIVTDFANRELAADISRPDCSVVGFEDQAAGGRIDNPSITAPPDQAAVLAYTSGSTGRPKAVMMTHRQFRRNVIIHTEAMEYSADDRLPLFGALSGGQAVTMTWCALLNGAMLCPFPVITKGVTGLADWMIDRAEFHKNPR